VSKPYPFLDFPASERLLPFGTWQRLLPGHRSGHRGVHDLGFEVHPTVPIPAPQGVEAPESHHDRRRRTRGTIEKAAPYGRTARSTPSAGPVPRAVADLQPPWERWCCSETTWPPSSINAADAVCLRRSLGPLEPGL